MSKSGMIEIDAGSVDWEVMADILSIDEDGEEHYGPEYVRINNLFVTPTMRGKGFAKALMDAADALIRKEYAGMKIKIVAEPKEESVSLDRLSAFYASYGYEVI